MLRGILLQYIHISNHHAVHLKELTACQLYLSKAEKDPKYEIQRYNVSGETTEEHFHVLRACIDLF